ncbi:MAG: metal-sensing transcriptional repressor [Lachnospiraceae bacterium]|nr:metal-sensing transcriptional repressor [Lachnospiraceae bacterium]
MNQEQEQVKNCCGSDCVLKYKHRDDREYKNLIHRLNRIEGQVRGIRTMVEEERYCVDIITQVSAITSALNAFNKALLSQHIKTCVADNIRSGNDEVIDELCETFKKLMR